MSGKSKEQSEDLSYNSVLGCVWGASVVVVCGVCVGACVWGGAGRGGEEVSLAALLSGYLGKSGHLPR